MTSLVWPGLACCQVANVMFSVIRQLSHPLSNQNMPSSIATMITLYDEKFCGSCLSLDVLALA